MLHDREVPEKANVDASRQPLFSVIKDVVLFGQCTVFFTLTQPTLESYSCQVCCVYFTDPGKFPGKETYITETYIIV